jgi:hypothetical protein
MDEILADYNEAELELLDFLNALARLSQAYARPVAK